jgi:hypothetical protein
MQRAALRPLQKGTGWTLFTSPIATSSTGNKNNKGFVSSHTRNVSSFTHANGSGLVRRTTTSSSTKRFFVGAAVGSQRRFASSLHGSNAGPGLSVHSYAVLLLSSPFFCPFFFLFRGERDRCVCCCARAMCQAGSRYGYEVSQPCCKAECCFSGRHTFFQSS